MLLRHGRDRCYLLQISDPACSESSVSTEGESASNKRGRLDWVQSFDMLQISSMGHLLIYEMMHSWNGSTLSWPPTSHTVNEMFLYSTVSTLKPEYLQGFRSAQYSCVLLCSARCRPESGKSNVAGKFWICRKQINRTDCGDSSHNFAEL